LSLVSFCTPCSWDIPRITRAGNISLKTLIAIPAVWAQTVWFQQDGATDTMFRKWILQLKCFEIKLTLAINSLEKIVHFSFYFNLKNRQVFLLDPVLYNYIIVIRDYCWATRFDLSLSHDSMTSWNVLLNGNLWRQLNNCII
jgi:hypothetical protein